MPSFGEKLKLEREKRKITLEQISSTTKISTRMLQALEQEKFTQLPGGIFNKGFVRAYARTLGLDEEQAVADYLEASGEAPRVEPAIREDDRDNPDRTAPLRITDESPGRLEIRAEIASRQLPWGVLAVILLVIAFGLSLWNYHLREQERAAHKPKPAPQGIAQAANPINPALAAPGSEGQSSTAGPTDSSVPPATSPTPENSSSQRAANSSATPAPGEFIVVIKARDESWLSVFVDGKPDSSETLKAGDQRTFHGRERVTMKVGNAAAVDFLLNGNLLPVGGNVGEVKTVTIGPSGVVQSIASPFSP